MRKSNTGRSQQEHFQCVRTKMPTAFYHQRRYWEWTVLRQALLMKVYFWQEYWEVMSWVHEWHMADRSQPLNKNEWTVCSTTVSTQGGWIRKPRSEAACLQISITLTCVQSFMKYYYASINGFNCDPAILQCNHLNTLSCCTVSGTANQLKGWKVFYHNTASSFIDTKWNFFKIIQSINIIINSCLHIQL